MRITLVIGGLGGGGAERVCVNLANAWVERGHHVTILTISQNTVTPAYETDSRVQRRDIGWPKTPRPEQLNTATTAPIMRGLYQARCEQQLTSHLALFAMLRQSILAQAPDVVVSHLDVTNLRVLAAMHETNVPIIACEHTDTTRVSIGAWQNIRGAMYRRARAIVTPHAESAEWLSKYDLNVVKIANPLIAPPGNANCENANCQFEIRNSQFEMVPADRRRLVALTRLAHEKRPELVVRAFASIASEFPEWDFDIYGDGPLRSWITHLVEKLAPKQIHLRGFTKEPYDVLRNADLFVSTSWVEGFGNSIWEALACGVPVVATDAGSSVRSLVREHIDGVIVREESVLAKWLAALMRNGPAREKMAMRAREVVTRFPPEEAFAAWDRLLSNVSVKGSEFSL